VWSAALALKPAELRSPDERPAFRVPASVRHVLPLQGRRLYVLDTAIDPLADDPARFRAVSLEWMPGGDRWHHLATFAPVPWEFGEREASPGVRLVDLGDGLWAGKDVARRSPRQSQAALAGYVPPSEVRRPWMDDAGNPSACTECGNEALRNGTRLCAACWSAFLAKRGMA
jgi:hypothetical protein